MEETQAEFPIEVLVYPYRVSPVFDIHFILKLPSPELSSNCLWRHIYPRVRPDVVYDMAHKGVGRGWNLVARAPLRLRQWMDEGKGRLYILGRGETFVVSPLTPSFPELDK